MPANVLNLLFYFLIDTIYQYVNFSFWSCFSDDLEDNVKSKVDNSAS